MLKQALIFLLIMIFFTSCSNEHPKQIKISATTWVGYTPLFYAKAKGWLKPLNIKLINVSSLAENMNVYKAKKSHAYVGTQFEYNYLKDNDLIPIIMFDRSNGGDIIMSNSSIEELNNTKSKIDAYLEMNSINYTILKDFLKSNKLSEKKINYINQDQTQISVLQSKNLKNNTLVVTYAPYNIQLEKNGFTEIASTKNGLELLVIDAMFTSKKTFSQNQKQFKDLKILINRAIDDLHADPKMFYTTIKPYMLELSYEEFKHALDDIVWINKNLELDLKQRLEKSNFPIRNLI